MSRKEKAKTSPAVLIGISAGGVVLIGAAVVLVIWACTSGKPQEFRAVSAPVAQRVPTANAGDPLAAPGGPPQAAASTPADDHPAQSTPPPASSNDVTSAPAGSQDVGGRVYERLLRSTVLIFNVYVRGNQIRVSQGSGMLVDKTNRLVLTNYHVVGHSQAVIVFFPKWQNGKLVSEPEYFFKLAKKKDGLTGLVLKRDPSHDLALVQLEKLPDGVEALPFAAVRSKVGDKVYSVGNAGDADNFWVLTDGIIRGFHQNQEKPIQGDGEIFTLKSDVIITNSSTNPGDSGGPLVNTRAEMIGVTQSLASNARNISFFIDIGEVRKFLDSSARQAGITLVLMTGPGIRGGGASPEDLATLMNDLNGTDRKARLRAVTKLGEQGPDAKLAVGSLLRALKDSDAELRSFIRDTLKKIGSPAESDVAAIVEVLDDPNKEVRLAAAEELAQAGPNARNAVAALAKNLSDPDTQIRRHVAQALRKIGVSDADRDALLPKLSEALKDRDPAVRSAIAQAMAEFSFGRDDVGRLRKYLAQEDPAVLSFAARALGKVGPAAKGTVPALIAAFGRANDTTVKEAVMQAFAGIGPDAKEGVPQIKEALGSGDLEVRRSAVAAAAVMGDSAGDTLPLLAETLKEPKLRDGTFAALRRLGHHADDATVISALVELLPDKKAQDQAIDTIKAIAPRDKQSAATAANALVSLLDNRLIAFRNKVETALAALKGPAVAPLTQALSNPDPAVRAGAADALRQLGPFARKSRACLRALNVAAQTDSNLRVRAACRTALVAIQSR